MVVVVVGEEDTPTTTIPRRTSLPRRHALVEDEPSKWA